MKIKTCFISNSSTSSFICSTDVSLEEIEELLKELLKMYNKFFIDNCLSDLKYDDVFEKPKYVNKVHMDSLWGEDTWAPNCWIKRDDDKYVEICGDMDNSIPHVLWDWIIEAFNGKRYHLG